MDLPSIAAVHNVYRHGLTGVYFRAHADLFSRELYSGKTAHRPLRAVLVRGTHGAERALEAALADLR